MFEVVVGVDPGTTESAYCVLTKDGKIQEFGKIPNDSMRVFLMDTAGSDAVLAMEMVASFGMSVGKSVFETCVWTGRFIECWQRYARHEYIRLTRKEVGLHVCNHPRANDSTVRRAMLDRHGEQGTKKNPGPTYGISKDCWSALAIATTGLDEVLSREILAHELSR